MAAAQSHRVSCDTLTALTQMLSDRRLRENEHPNRKIFAAWLVLCAIMVLTAMQRILQGQFPDPDDILRLVQVRDLVGGQGWFDTTQYRIAPPDGVPMHWSRLVDLPLALMIVVLTPLFGAGAAEQIALIGLPLLIFGAALWFIGRVAWRLLGPQTAVYACLACGFMPVILFQFQPMRIDHHGWQVLSVAVGVWALAFRNAAQGGIIAGLAMAVGLMISIELLPMAGAFGLVLFVRWWRDRYDKWWLVSYMQSLAAGLAGLYLATRGWSDLTQYCDSVSPAHLGFFLVTALGTGAVAWGTRARGIGLLLVLAMVGTAGLIFFAISSPNCVTTPFGTLDPLVRDYWYVLVLEGQPFWRQDMARDLPVLLQLLVGLVSAVVLTLRSQEWLRRWWQDYTILLICAIVLAVFVWRSAAFAAIIAAVPLGWALAGFLNRFRSAGSVGTKIAALALIILLLVPSAPVMLVQKLVPQEQGNGSPIAKTTEASCEIRDQAAKLNALDPATIFAPLDIGPSILLKSHHSVIATGHHRAETAMRDVIGTFIGPAQAARPVMAHHGAGYVALCTDLVEPDVYASAGPDGLMAMLLDDREPDWLEPVALDTSREFRIWRIVNPPAPTPDPARQ